MAEDAATTIDAAWLAAHPLPVHGEGTDKNSRGHVVAVGGSRSVPGGLLLTGEAALRAGAGKVQLATIESAAIGMGIAMPEAGVLALAETVEGEIDAAGLEPLADNLKKCDSVVVGPAMSARGAVAAVIEAMLDGLLDEQTLLLDAVAIHAAGECEKGLRDYRGTLIVTPNPDELASLLDCEEARLTDDPAGCAREAAERFDAVTVCKSDATLIAAPDGTLLRYPGGGVGLATGGSGDVLAGIIAGLVARGADPICAAAWGVWLHGEAGKRLGEDTGEDTGGIGFLARDLLPLVPRLIGSAASK